MASSPTRCIVGSQLAIARDRGTALGNGVGPPGAALRLPDAPK